MDDLEPDDEAPGETCTWQPEAVRIEAAEFLLATRAQQEHRLRVAEELRGLGRRGSVRPAGIEPATNCLEGSRSIR